MLEGMLYGVGAYRWLLVGALRNECSAFAGGDVDYSLGLSFGFSLAVYDFFLIQYSSASLRIFSALRIASLDSSLFFLWISSILRFQFYSSILISFPTVSCCFSRFNVLFSIFFLKLSSISLVFSFSFSLTWLRFSCTFCRLLISDANLAIYSVWRKEYPRRLVWTCWRPPSDQLHWATPWTSYRVVWEKWRQCNDPYGIKL